MNIGRRGFLSGIIAACAAPGIIRIPALIMPIKAALIVAPEMTLEGHFLTWSCIGIREDLINLICNIDLQETPFMNAPHEWQAMRLEAA